MTNNTCKNCKFWESGNESFVDNDKHRDCNLMIRYSLNSMIVDDKIMFDSNDDYELICKTGYNFGCIHFENK